MNRREKTGAGLMIFGILLLLFINPLWIGLIIFLGWNLLLPLFGLTVAHITYWLAVLIGFIVSLFFGMLRTAFH